MDNNISRGGQEIILPDASGLFYAIRSMGYENTAAIADLVDNSIDAKASNIWISVDEDLSKIFIADDGIGMSNDTLHNAIRVGGKKDHDEKSDLGKYGLGLITASMSMGRVIRVITKKDGIYNTVVLDYDEIQKTNTFCANFYTSTDAEIRSFNYRTKDAESGTVLVIDKCDKMQYTTAKSFIEDLGEIMSEVFHMYLDRGKHIYVNENALKSSDPLFIARLKSKKLVDEDVEIKTTSGVVGMVHVLAALIPDQGAKINKSLHLNIQRQGFYILRNKREIAAGLEFPEIFGKHNDFNLFRIEVSFDSELDDLMGINLKKHDIAPSQEVINALRNVLDEQVKKVRKIMKEKQKKKNPFIESVPVLAGNGNKVSAPAAAVAGSNVIITPASSGIELPVPADDQDYDFVFSTHVGDANGPLFKTLVSGKRITVYYNIRNNYYSEKVLADDSGVKIKETLNSSIKASAQAYLKTVKTASALTLFMDTLAGSFNKEG